ncbi:hypothetical protein A2U01_0072751, partial [Trifolium medium]|nr:hypothetical protein [Trifolium medium]
ITGFGIMKGMMQSNWVGKHFILGMNGSWHKTSTNTLLVMNKYSSNNHGSHHSLDG